MLGRRKLTAGRQVAPLVSALSVVACAALLPVGCSSESKTELVASAEAGSLRLDLSAVSTTGRVYRVRQGTFAITGRDTGFGASVETDSSPNQSSLLVELPADTYDVHLEPGYELELIEDFGLAFRIRSGLAQGDRTRPAIRVDEPDAGASPIVTPPPTAPGDPGVGGSGGGGMGPIPPSEGLIVPAELISANPAVVTVSENEISSLSFIFRLQNEVVETRSGGLRLAVEVIDDGFTPPPACTDSFEPNQTFETAAAIDPSVITEATLCDRDVDNYSFVPPVAEGETFAVNLTVSGGVEFLDAVLFDSEGFFTGFGNSTPTGVTVLGVADGGPVVLQTSGFLFSEPEIQYSVEVGPGPSQGENQCCETSPFPGCAEPEVEQCICDLDPFCCEVQFDGICADLGFQCGSICNVEPPTSDCCTATDEPGCLVPEVNSCICAVDSSCCTDSFDAACVSQAIAECGAQCTVAEPESDCCSASGAPGCTIPSVESCVCEIDSFCCLGSFDDNCAALAASQCDVQCGE